MNTRRIFAFLAVAAIAVVGGVTAGHWLRGGAGIESADAASSSQANAVAQLWAAPVTSVDGKAQSLSLYKGHPVVINFWASWCGPCVEEMPTLAQLNHQYAKKGIQFVGLGVDSGKSVQAFLQKVRVDYPVYVIGFGGADLARAFGNTAGGLPFTVVIDAKGTIRSTKLGQIQPKELQQTLDAL